MWQQRLMHRSSRGWCWKITVDCNIRSA